MDSFMAKSSQRQLSASVKAGMQASMIWGSALALSLVPSISSVALSHPHLSPPTSSIPSPTGLSSPSTLNSISPAFPPVSPDSPRDVAKAIAPSTYVTPTPSYSQPQIDYFLNIAMGSEYGGATPHIRKWATDLHIEIHGTPTTQDIASLETVVDELNGLIDPIDLKILNEGPRHDGLNVESGLAPETANVNIHFVPHTDFAHYVPHYEPGNLGYAWIWWQNDTIYDATILVSSTGINQTERSHLIREELTQSLGLLRDSYDYEDSIFFQLWTTTTQYSALDEALIRMLYSPQIQPGMTRQAVVSVFADGAIHAWHSPANATVSD